MADKNAVPCPNCGQAHTKSDSACPHCLHRQNSANRPDSMQGQPPPPATPARPSGTRWPNQQVTPDPAHPNPMRSAPSDVPPPATTGEPPPPCEEGSRPSRRWLPDSDRGQAGQIPNPGGDYPAVAKDRVTAEVTTGVDTKQHTAKPLPMDAPQVTATQVKPAGPGHSRGHNLDVDVPEARQVAFVPTSESGRDKVDHGVDAEPEIELQNVELMALLPVVEEDARPGLTRHRDKAAARAVAARRSAAGHALRMGKASPLAASAGGRTLGEMRPGTGRRRRTRTIAPPRPVPRGSRGKKSRSSRPPGFEPPRLPGRGRR